MTNTDQKPEVRISKGPSKLFTEHYALLMFCLFAIFAAAAFFLLRPLIMGIKETNAATQSELVHLSAQKTYLASLDQSVAAAQSIPSDMLDRVNQALPNDVGSPAMLMQFSAAAARNGVQVVSIGFNPEVKAPTPGRAATTTSDAQGVNIEMSLKGRNYLDVKRFLADVERSLRLMDVTSISSNGGGTGAATYQVQIKTYVFKPSGTTRP